MLIQRHIRRWLVAGVSFIAVAGGAAFVHADQIGTEWIEQPTYSDAAETPGTAQIAYGTGSMTAIRGVVSGTDADVYAIRIPDFSQFSATTVGGASNGADTQLFLFTSSGVGIACNDDTGSASQSTLPLGSALYSGYGPGTYLLAISRFNHDPVSASGLIFPDTPTNGVYGPTGPGGGSPLLGWAGGSGTNSTYAIFLTGVEFVSLTPDVPPTAVAGPDQSIHASGTVLLDGSASFDDNTPSATLDYFWSFVSVPSGSAAVLSSPNTAQTTFEADLAGSYVVQLIVRDSAGQFSAASQLTVSSTNLAPTANAGTGQSVIVGDVVTLDGSGSTDPENDSLTYQWTLSQAPTGSAAALTGSTTVSPTFVPDLPGTYTAELVVDDGFGPSAPASVQIVVITGAQYAENTIVCVQATVASLPASSVTTGGNKQAFSNFLRQAIQNLQSGDIADARHKLQETISRTDGCALRGSPDGNGPGRDWITNCTDQAAIYGQLVAALDAIAP